MSNSEQHHIIDFSQELSVGESPEWFEKIAAAFPALQSRNYRLYFFGQLVSLIGTWLQIVAEGWLVLELTNSAFLVGVVAALATVPSLFLSLFGGVLVDRYPKKYILLVTQTLAMVFAGILGILALLHVITVWEIGLLAFLLGVVTAVDTPARQAFVVELVDRDQLASAIALNSGTFNAARVIGPSVAGFVIALLGTGGGYLLNAASYIAVIVALFFIQVPIIWQKKTINTLQALQEGVGYAFSHPIIRTLLLFVGIVSIFGWSYTTIMPVIAKHTFHLGAAGLGYLYAAGGLGALVATVLVSVFSKKIPAFVFVFGGNALFAISIFLFTFTTSLPLALILLFSSGVGLLSQFATMNTMIQHMVDDTIRGRVMSLYALMFLGLSPIGNFEIGFVTEHVSSNFALRLGTIIVFLFGMVVFSQRNKIKRLNDQYRIKQQH